jgi:hypothetical protein
MPEPVDFGGEEVDALGQRRDVCKLRGQDLGGLARVESGFQDVLDWRQAHAYLGQALADFELCISANRRWISIALHPDGHANRSGEEGQGSLGAEPKGELGEDGQVGVKTDAIKPSDSERE